MSNKENTIINSMENKETKENEHHYNNHNRKHNSSLNFDLEIKPLDDSDYFANKNLSQFNLEEKLGEGTFGKVRLGIHLQTGEKVAVKILDKTKILDNSDKQRIEREIKILKIMFHNNIIKLYSVIQTYNYIYLVMELAEEKDLSHKFKYNERLNESQARKYFQQILSGVEYIHKNNVVHRDLKPENLMLNYNDDIKIADFGLSCIYKKNETLTTACGSPCYACPEMISKKGYKGLPADIWSCGVILYYMVCGYLPFDDKQSDTLYKKITEGKYRAFPEFLSYECKDLIQKILNVEPKKRISIERIKLHSWFTGESSIFNIFSTFNISSDKSVIGRSINNKLEKKNSKSVKPNKMTNNTNDSLNNNSNHHYNKDTSIDNININNYTSHNYTRSNYLNSEESSNNANIQERKNISLYSQIKELKDKNKAALNHHNGLLLTETIIPIDEEIVEFMKNKGFDSKEIRENILFNRFNHITTVYYLILKKHIREDHDSVAKLGGKLFQTYMRNKNNYMKFYDYNIDYMVSERVLTPKSKIANLSMIVSIDSRNNQGNEDARSKNQKNNTTIDKITTDKEDKLNIYSSSLEAKTIQEENVNNKIIINISNNIINNISNNTYLSNNYTDHSNNTNYNEETEDKISNVDNNNNFTNNIDIYSKSEYKEELENNMFTCVSLEKEVKNKLSDNINEEEEKSIYYDGKANKHTLKKKVDGSLLSPNNNNGNDKNNNTCNNNNKLISNSINKYFRSNNKSLYGLDVRKVKNSNSKITKLPEKQLIENLRLVENAEIDNMSMQNELLGDTGNDLSGKRSTDNKNNIDNYRNNNSDNISIKDINNSVIKKGESNLISDSYFKDRINKDRKKIFKKIENNINNSNGLKTSSGRRCSIKMQYISNNIKDNTKDNNKKNYNDNMKNSSISRKRNLYLSEIKDNNKEEESSVINDNAINISKKDIKLNAKNKAFKKSISNINNLRGCSTVSNKSYLQTGKNKINYSVCLDKIDYDNKVNHINPSNLINKVLKDIKDSKVQEIKENNISIVDNTKNSVIDEKKKKLKIHFNLNNTFYNSVVNVDELSITNHTLSEKLNLKTNKNQIKNKKTNATMNSTAVDIKSALSLKTSNKNRVTNSNNRKLSDNKSVFNLKSKQALTTKNSNNINKNFSLIFSNTHYSTSLSYNKTMKNTLNMKNNNSLYFKKLSNQSNSNKEESRNNSNLNSNVSNIKIEEITEVKESNNKGNYIFNEKISSKKEYKLSINNNIINNSVNNNNKDQDKSFPSNAKAKMTKHNNTSYLKKSNNSNKLFTNSNKLGTSKSEYKGVKKQFKNTNQSNLLNINNSPEIKTKKQPSSSKYVSENTNFLLMNEKNEHNLGICNETILEKKCLLENENDEDRNRNLIDECNKDKIQDYFQSNTTIKKENNKNNGNNLLKLSIFGDIIDNIDSCSNNLVNNNNSNSNDNSNKNDNNTNKEILNNNILIKKDKFLSNKLKFPIVKFKESNKKVNNKYKPKSFNYNSYNNRNLTNYALMKKNNNNLNNEKTYQNTPKRGIKNAYNPEDKCYLSILKISNKNKNVSSPLKTDYIANDNLIKKSNKSVNFNSNELISEKDTININNNSNSNNIQYSNSTNFNSNTINSELNSSKYCKDIIDINNLFYMKKYLVVEMLFGFLEKKQIKYEYDSISNLFAISSTKLNVYFIISLIEIEDNVVYVKYKFEKGDKEFFKFLVSQISNDL